MVENELMTLYLCTLRQVLTRSRKTITHCGSDSIASLVDTSKLVVSLGSVVWTQPGSVVSGACPSRQDDNRPQMKV